MTRDFALPDQPRAVLAYIFYLFAELLDLEVTRQEAYQPGRGRADFRGKSARD